MKMKFTEVFSDNTKNGKKIQTIDYLPSGNYPIIDQGRECIAGYSNMKEGVFVDVPAIVFGDHTRIVKYVDTPFFLGADGVKVFRCKIDKADYKYLFYCLQAMRIPDTGYNRHFKWLKESYIPLPPLDEQRRIAAVLDKVSDLIAKRRQQLEKLDELVKARFVEMFGDFKTNPMGWPIVPFREIAKIDANMTMDFDKYANYPHIGIENIEKTTGTLRGYKTVAEDNVLSGKYIFTHKHIIYSKLRPNLNKVALPDFDGVCSSDAYPILPFEEKCNRIFLAHNMRSNFFLDYIVKLCGGTNLPRVNRKEILDFQMPLPPVELQSRFATFVGRAEKVKKCTNWNLGRLEILKKALMQRYFE